MKKTISIMLCVMMMLSLMSVVAFAEQIAITAVTINGLDFPVIGRDFDTDYTVPAGAHYLANSGMTAVEWMKAEGAAAFKPVAENEKPQAGYSYKAVLHIMRESYDYIFNSTDNISVTVNTLPQNKATGANAQFVDAGRITVNVYFYPNTVYGPANWPEVTVDRDGKSDWPAAGETPWASSEFINKRSVAIGTGTEFTVQAQWYAEGQNPDYVTPLASDYKFIAGKKYYLRLILTAGNAAIFGFEDKDQAVLLLNGESGDIETCYDEKIIARFPFTCYAGIDSLTVESITAPSKGAAVQKTGFTCNNPNATVEFGKLEYVAKGMSTPADYKEDTFTPGKHYSLTLYVKPAAGYVLNMEQKDIEVNCGDIESFGVDSNGDGVLKIGFDVNGEVIDTVSAYVTVPVAGGKPGMNPSVPANAGYSVNTELNGGIAWLDVKAVHVLGESDTFEAGKTYKVSVFLKPDSGYSFHESDDAITATVNGKLADMVVRDEKRNSIAVVMTYVVEDTLEWTDCNGVIEHCPSLKMYEDAPAYDNWAHDAIDWAMVKEITNGIDDRHFGTANPCTRGQVVTFLWRAAGCPEPGNTNNPFTDVKEGAFYYKAVLWAVENNITKGVSATSFKPSGKCTRGQIVTFIWRYEGEPKAKNAANPFTDVKSDAFCYDAVLWAVENNITNGTSATTFGPDATCTRAHVVTFLFRDMVK